MPNNTVTYSIASGGTVGPGNGVQNPFIEVNLQMPGSYYSGANLVTFFGNVKGVAVAGDSSGQQAGTLLPPKQLQNLSVGNTLAIPSVPGSVTTFWNLQVDPYTGIVTMYSSVNLGIVGVPPAQPCAAPNAAVPQLIIGNSSVKPGSFIPWLDGWNFNDFVSGF